MTDKENILEYVPVQNSPWGRDEKGRVFLIQERTRNRLLKKFIDWLGRSQEMYIHLDELGSAAWLAADGERRILDIAASMKTASTGGMDQAEARLAKFFALLAREGFVRWRGR